MLLQNTCNFYDSYLKMLNIFSYPISQLCFLEMLCIYLFVLSLVFAQKLFLSNLILTYLSSLNIQVLSAFVHEFIVIHIST